MRATWCVALAVLAGVAVSGGCKGNKVYPTPTPNSGKAPAQQQRGATGAQAKPAAPQN